jgi:hypothetical protein
MTGLKPVMRLTVFFTLTVHRVAYIGIIIHNGIVVAFRCFNEHCYTCTQIIFLKDLVLLIQ